MATGTPQRGSTGDRVPLLGQQKVTAELEYLKSYGASQTDLESMSRCLEQLAAGQTRVEAMLSGHNHGDSLNLSQHLFVDDKSPRAGRTANEATPATGTLRPPLRLPCNVPSTHSTHPMTNESKPCLQLPAMPTREPNTVEPPLVELFPDPRLGKPFELREVLRAMYLKQDRLEKRFDAENICMEHLQKTLEHLQKTLALEIAEKLNSTFGRSMQPLRSASPRSSVSTNTTHQHAPPSAQFLAPPRVALDLTSASQLTPQPFNERIRASKSRKKRATIGFGEDSLALTSRHNLPTSSNCITSKPLGKATLPRDNSPTQGQKSATSSVFICHKASHSGSSSTPRASLRSNPKNNKRSSNDVGSDPEAIKAGMQGLGQELEKVGASRCVRETRLRKSEKRKEKSRFSHENTATSLVSAPTTDLSSFKLRQRQLKKMLDHPFVDGLCAMMILFNSVLIGVAVEHTTKHKEEAPWMEIAGYTCNAFFFVELLLRMASQGAKYFYSDEWAWNTFDFVLVAFSVLDVITEILMDQDGSSVSSGLKTVKMLRIVRIFRVFRFFSELSLLALMIADSIKSLCWALLMFTIIIYVFAIIFTQTCSDYAWAHDGQESTLLASIDEQFGSLPKTIYFLVQSMLGGISWGEVSGTLLEVDYFATSMFFLFIAFTLLAVLNIITGVFVDNAVETARTQRDYIASKERTMREKYIQEMSDFFMAMDADQSGTVTLEEMVAYFKDIHIQNMFHALGIDPQDVERLFLLLDDDLTGEIHVDEFLEGCLRLKGDAKSIDVHTVLAVCRRINHRLDAFLPESATRGSHLGLARYPVNEDFSETLSMRPSTGQL